VNTTITGTGFDDGAIAFLVNSSTNDFIAGDTTFVDSTTLQAAFDLTDAPPGGWDVVVVNGDDGLGGAPDLFTVTAPPPTVSSVSPTTITAGADHQPLTVVGTNFFDGATASFDGTGITVNDVQRTDPQHLTLTVSVDPSAPLTDRTLTVTNADSHSAQCGSPCLTVVPVAHASIATPAAVDGAVSVAFDRNVKGVTTSNFAVRESGKTSNVAVRSLTCKDALNATTVCSSTAVRSATLSLGVTLTPGQYYNVLFNPAGPAPISSPDGVSVASQSPQFRAQTDLSESSPAISYQWRNVGNANAYGGSFRQAHLKGETARFAFTGTSITWYTVTGPDQGYATVSIDGASKGTINNYASSTHYKVARTFGSLSNAGHTIVITVAGTKPSGATNTMVSVDALKVGSGSVISTPSGVYSWQHVPTSAALGGAYNREDLAGGEMDLTYRSGSSGSISWCTLLAPFMGRANIYIDGRLYRTADDYSSTVGRKCWTFASSNTVHTIRVVVLGTRSSSATGTMVAIDDMKIV
jgi:hypothetical protein